MLPAKKTSKARTRNRRSHHALKAPNFYFCKESGTVKLPHTACGKTGYVNPKLTLDLESNK
jgi:large subunit ribosomal protein L32